MLPAVLSFLNHSTYSVLALKSNFEGQSGRKEYMSCLCLQKISPHKRKQITILKYHLETDIKSKETRLFTFDHRAYLEDAHITKEIDAETRKTENLRERLLSY